MKKLNDIVNYFNELYPNPKTELIYHNNFELLISVILSAQTTDKQVNKVTPNLFDKYPHPLELSKANIMDVEMIIKSIGLYKTKAKNIILTSKMLIDKYEGIIPSNYDDLLKLPGVGRKTANVILANCFNKNTFAVDTHVNRVAKRLKIADKEDSLLKVEFSLVNFFKGENFKKLHHQLILFGRYFCMAKNPNCNNCKIKKYCIMGDTNEKGKNI